MSPVNPIPKGMHTVTPQITVTDANKAIDFYKQAFNAEEMNRHRTPDGRVMHADIRIGDAHIFVNDSFPEMGGASAPAAFSNSPFLIHLYVQDADSTFNQAVKAGAKVKMPLSNMFWGDRYGMVDDPYGCRWSIGTHVEDVSPDEMRRRAEAMFAQPAHR